MRLKLITLFITCLVAFILTGQRAYAGAAHNMSGWAWSDTAGWISFNNLTDGSTIDYGVNLNPSTKKLSGYAWSENLGWISFNETDTTACDTGTLAPAKLLSDNVTFEGCARIFINWGSYIKLKGTTQDGSAAFGVTLDGNALRGYAWGDSDTGWIQMDPPGGGVFYNNSGNVRIGRVDSNGTTNLGGTTAVLDGGMQLISNPAVYQKISAGNHTAGVLQDTRSVRAGKCSYLNTQTECLVTVFDTTPTCDGITCSVPITVTAGNTTKVVFKYTQAVGDILVKRIGIADDVSTTPPGTYATVDSVTLSANPAIYLNMSTMIAHAVSASSLDGYSTLVGTCTYSIPASGTLTSPDNCTVSTFTNITTNPTTNITPASGMVTKVVFKYVPDVVTECQPENPSHRGVRIKEAPVGQPVRWAIVGEVNPEAMYEWREGPITIGAGLGLGNVIQTYTVRGQKSVNVAVDGNPSSLCDMVNGEQSFRVTANPYYRDY